MNSLMTTRQAAEYLGVELDTIYIYIRSKRLKAFKLGGNGKSKRHWRIFADDLKAFVLGQGAEVNSTAKHK